MSSGGFPGPGDLYTSLAGTGAGFGKRTLTEMERQQLQQALLLTRSVKHKTAGLYNQHQHQQQMQHNHQLHHLPYYNASPISPLGNHPLSPADNIDYSSCSGQPVPSPSCSSSTTSASGTHNSGSFHHPPPSLNGMSPLAFIKQQQQQQQQLLMLRQQQQQQNQLLQQRKAGLFLNGNNNNGAHGIQLAGMGGQQQQGIGSYLSNTEAMQHRLAASLHPPQPPAGGTSEVRNRLLELEKQLLDDDDGDGRDGSGAPTTTPSPIGGAAPPCSASQALLNTSEWSDTIHGGGVVMMSATSSCSTPPPPPQQPQPNQPPQHQHQQPPRTPTATTSAASSCCSSSSPPTTSSSSLSAASAKQLLMESASAIAEGNAKSAVASLAALRKSMAAAAAADNLNNSNNNPRPSDPEQRLNEFMSAALLSRISNSDASSCSSSEQLSSGEHLAASQLLYEQSPLFKLGFQAANLAVLDATRGAAVIHILDFDVGHGGQLLPLVSALAERPAAARPALVKITAVSDPAANPYTTNVGYSPMVRSAGERLIKAGQKAGIAIRFNTITTRTGGEAAAAALSSSSSSDQFQPLTRHAIGCDPDESLVVRLAYNLSRIPDESVTPSNPRDHLLRRIKSMNPAVVALAEQELSGNTAPFLPRFADAHAHYAALFESLQHQQDGAAPEILRRAEECLGRKAANTVAKEGSGRVERCEVFGKWRARMSMAGFRPVPLPTGAVDSLRAKASSLAAGGGTAAGGGGGVVVKEENGGVGFAWNGRTITVTSAWR